MHFIVNGPFLQFVCGCIVIHHLHPASIPFRNLISRPVHRRCDPPRTFRNITCSYCSEYSINNLSSSTARTRSQLVKYYLAGQVGSTRIICTMDSTLGDDNRAGIVGDDERSLLGSQLIFHIRCT